MNFNNTVIRYQGFHPSEYTEAYIKELLSEISLEGPNGSSVNAVFTRKKDVFKGIIKVNSSAGPLFAVVSGTGLKEVSHKLMAQMRKRLDKWKSKRFERTSIKEYEAAPELDEASSY